MKICCVENIDELHRKQTVSRMGDGLIGFPISLRVGCAVGRALGAVPLLETLTLLWQGFNYNKI